MNRHVTPALSQAAREDVAAMHATDESIGSYVTKSDVSRLVVDANKGIIRSMTFVSQQGVEGTHSCSIDDKELSNTLENTKRIKLRQTER